MATASQPRQRAERNGRGARALTCANCRVRKTRCDGTQPGCKTCEVYNDQCRYEKPPPMSQIIAMATRLQETERTITELRKALNEASTPATEPGTSVYPSSEAPIHREAPTAPAESIGSMQSDVEASTQSAGGDVTTEERLLSDLSLDENGRFCYHGPTSAVHAPLARDDQLDTRLLYDEQSTKSDARRLLTSTALEARTWEEFALGNAALQTNIPRHIISRLLQIHWTWIGPTFMWVYRPAFMRDMAIGGPFYSPFLLTVMCAHAARFDQGQTGELLIARARLLLGNEIHRPSCIPTVQALLQLSARDLAYGSISQAWLYSGMAFRMVSDLGLHHSTAKIGLLRHLSPEDLEIRRRLFWSCYFWDKAISLYLGRMPVLPELPFGTAPELLDDSAEDDIWSPHSVEAMNLSRVSIGEYPQTKSHMVSGFENSCKLAIILNEIMRSLYSRRGSSKADDTLRSIRSNLDQWRTLSPPHLKLDPENLPQICPPPHILTQNLLYFATIILLHRPFYTIPVHHAACRKASDSIEKLALLLDKTFGFSRITYLMAYCIYTAASVLMLDVKKGDVEAHVKMQTFMHVLRQGTGTCPVVQRSLDIITNGLRNDNGFAEATMTDSNPGAGGFVAPNYLPAFPYRDLETGYSSNTHSGNMDIEGFSLLDCFPETQFDSTDYRGDWFMPTS